MCVCQHGCHCSAIIFIVGVVPDIFNYVLLPKARGVEKASEDVVGEEQGMGELRSTRKRHGAFLGCVP